MCPLVRTPNSCCVNKAIQHLSFDPSLQDSAWNRAQARPKPYHTAERDKCSRKTDKGELVCDAAVLDVLDTLGVSLDPMSRTAAAKPKQHVKREQSPTTDRLAHKSLYIPGNQSKSPMSCADYLKRHPGANRVRMLAEIAACLQYLHANKIIHGSIRPESLFVDDEGYPLLSYSPDSTPSINAQSDPYSAPELHEAPGRSRPTIQSDIYSFGSIVHWMCTGKHPYHTEPAKLPPSLRDIPSARALRSLALNLGPPSSNLQPQLNSKVVLAELTDYTLKNLVAQCRSTLPAARPVMLSIVLQLQQILVRHVLPTLPLPPPSAPMSSSLSAYIPRSRQPGITESTESNIPTGAFNTDRALVLSPRPSPSPSLSSSARPRDARAQNQSLHNQEFFYRDEYRSDQRSAPQPAAYTGAMAGTSRQYERQHDWSQPQPHHHQPEYRRSTEGREPFDFKVEFTSVPPTPRYDPTLHSHRDAAPKLAFHPPDSPISPHGPRWDVPYAANYPVSAGLQPPSNAAWVAPSSQGGGANVHRNRTL